MEVIASCLMFLTWLIFALIVKIILDIRERTRKMDKKRALELLQIEKECVRRNSGEICDRDCANCDLLQDTDELIAMYKYVISSLEENNNVNSKRK